MLISNYKTLTLYSYPVDFPFIVIAITEHLWTDIDVASYRSTTLISLAVTGICNNIQTLTVATYITHV